MLTKELLRCKIEGERVVPLLLRPTPGNLEMAEKLSAHWRAGVGQRLGDLEEASTLLLHQSRALVAARGLQKLIIDGCRFSDPAPTETLRREALAASATLLARPAADADAHRALVAEKLGIAAETLQER